MNDQTTVLRSLFWKDTRTIKPLVIMAFIGVLLFNALAFIGHLLINSSTRLDTFISIWILMPNLVALGAPALLVGGEEESGTLTWLRSLPIRWQRIIDAKFIVATAAVLVTWLFASLFMAGILVTDAFPPRSDLGELTGVLGICKLLFFSMFLLTLSFVFAYAFRSPITALIVLVPSITVIYAYASAVGGYLVSRRFSNFAFGSAGDYVTPVPTVMWFAVFALALLMLAGFWFLQRWLGKRRFTQPAGNRIWNKAFAGNTQQAYQPPLSVRAPQPSPIRALHWQQFRQIRWAFLGLTLLGVGGVLMISYANEFAIENTFFKFLNPFSPLAVITGSVGLGAIVFYGDNVNRRRLFFADRGIKPGQVWWTRMAVPLVACLVIAMLAVLLNRQNSRDMQSLWVWVLTGFACGQTTSMCVSRPVLGLFGAPLFGAVCAIPLAIFFDSYPGYGVNGVLMVPILLFATRWLSDRWIAGKTDLSFYLQIAGLATFAILLPMICVVSYRVATTPALNQTWRAEAIAATPNVGLPGPSPLSGFYSFKNEILQWGSSSENWTLDGEYGSVAVVRETLETELSSIDFVPFRVANDGMAAILDPTHKKWEMSDDEHTALRHLAIKVILARVNYVRTLALDFQLNLIDLDSIAETPELQVVRLLSADPDLYGDAKAVRELVAMLPSDELRRESRIKTLLAEWRRFQPDFTRSTIKTTGMTVLPTFGGIPLHSNGLLGIEKRRSSRFLDETVRVLWRQLKTGLPAYDSSAIERRTELWRNTTSPRYSQWGNWSHGFHTWTQENEQAIKTLRRRYAVD